MNKPDELFSSEEMMRFEAVLKRHIEAAAKAPLLILMTFLAGLALASRRLQRVRNYLPRVRLSSW